MLVTGCLFGHIRWPVPSETIASGGGSRLSEWKSRRCFGKSNGGQAFGSKPNSGNNWTTGWTPAKPGCAGQPLHSIHADAHQQLSSCCICCWQPGGSSFAQDINCYKPISCHPGYLQHESWEGTRTCSCAGRNPKRPCWHQGADNKSECNHFASWHCARLLGILQPFHRDNGYHLVLAVILVGWRAKLNFPFGNTFCVTVNNNI